MNTPSLPAADALPAVAEPLDEPAAESSVESPAESPSAPQPGPRDILKTLYARFPVFRAGEPLAIGIDKAVRVELPDLPKKNLRIALSIHTHSNRYLRNMAKAGQRLDLQGASAGGITDSQRQYAAERLQERLRKRTETAASAATPPSAAAPETPPAALRNRPKKTPAQTPPRPEKAAAAPRRQAEKPPAPQKPLPSQTLENAAPLSLAEKLALLSEKYARK
ncbi:MAG: ProQ/FinO family protein [Zoogloeaceae bacterium]|jgi:ProP effector|nr:ProQ/FinO family protein [Zoogloeaceae bacterium]